MVGDAEPAGGITVAVIEPAVEAGAVACRETVDPTNESVLTASQRRWVSPAKSDLGTVSLWSHLFTSGRISFSIASLLKASHNRWVSATKLAFKSSKALCTFSDLASELIASHMSMVSLAKSSLETASLRSHVLLLSCESCGWRSFAPAQELMAFHICCVS
jgi:hypothetical protein